MAENKKSFILYADLLKIVEQLPDDVAGKLFKIILRYVNDLEVDIEDLLLRIAFEPIKLQLKRDLKDWENAKEEKSVGGRIGNLKRWNKDLYERFLKKEITLEDAKNIIKNRIVSGSDKTVSLPIASVAVNDTVTVTVNDTVTVIHSLYSESEFLKDWKETREFYDKLPTNIIKLQFHEQTDFREALKIFDKEKIKNAMVGLFQQKNMFPASRLRPKHFLENIDKYLDCFNNKQQLFEDKNKNSLPKIPPVLNPNNRKTF
jgi:Family of unknown function (DUF6291)